VTIGILGLQGAYEQHRSVLSSLNVSCKIVRYPEDLDACDGLIIPGGESTTMSKMINYMHFRESLLKFAESNPVFGICAGLILMAKNSGDKRVNYLGLIDIGVERNSYGRQVDSFTQHLEIFLTGEKTSIHGVFIRAPRIKSIGNGVTILGELNGEPIFVQRGKHLAAAFHPELSGSTEIHRYFLSLIKEPVLEKAI
tara:strand:- start:112 stop:702 length:591 start_codon:yes stop_codon:yes gene_type:complete